MNTATLLLILGGFAVAALGVLYRRVRIWDLPDVSDREFLAELARLHPITVPPERALQARRRVARILREAAGLDQRAETPETIGELITDLLI